jgi:hypothetical protein
MVIAHKHYRRERHSEDHSMQHEPVGYQADADTWCRTCALARYGAGIGFGAIDREGNDVHPLFGRDEAGDTPEHCGACGAYIDTSWTGSTMGYAIEVLAEAVEARGTRDDVRDIWRDKLRWCAGLTDADKVTIAAYDSLPDALAETVALPVSAATTERFVTELGDQR